LSLLCIYELATIYTAPRPQTKCWEKFYSPGFGEKRSSMDKYLTVITHCIPLKTPLTSYCPRGTGVEEQEPRAHPGGLFHTSEI